MRIYLDFCERYQKNPVNPDLDTILAYLEYLARRLASPKSVTNYWSGVKLMHAYLKEDFVYKDAMEVKFMFKSISNSKRHVSKQKKP